ncbi:unnamed protein product [Owenia fusiformis]|uniref:Uncharacterized protein n=1 Tax=Owenia fusiformis TaxID=6347 RepID=A0A8J1UGL7_OWEFU|nr:unnamed protein product [Owenia fusiformis]
MEDIITLLGTYRGRDKFIRTTSYVLHVIAGTRNPENEATIRGICAQFSKARVILRLFDDLPMLGYSLSYGLGKHEKDPIIRILSVLGLISGQAYFPVEHIAWAADAGLINVKDSSKWWQAGTALWGCSLVIGILRSLRLLARLQGKIGHMKKQRKLEASSEYEQTYKSEMANIRKQAQGEFLTIAINLADLMCAVNWLPEGFLWSGTFNATQTGVFGSISSSLGLLKLFIEQKAAKKKAA